MPDMSTPLVVLCPGQGAQAVGMGKAWFDASPEARKVFADADRILGDQLGSKLSDLCFETHVKLARPGITEREFCSTATARRASACFATSR